MHRLFWLLMFLCAGTAQVVSVEIKAGDSGPLAQPAREPGDRVEIDPMSGDLMVESRGLRSMIVRHTHVTPEFTATVEHAGAGVRYSYLLRNAPGAKQFITLFCVDVPSASGIKTEQPPTYWFANTVLSNAVVRNCWGRSARDDDDTGKLEPGKIAGPFSFEAQALPGLTKAYVFGYSKTMPVDEGEEEKLSPRVRDTINQMMNFENDALIVHTIAPKIRPNTNVFVAVREELAAASKLAAFSDIRSNLTALSATGDKAFLRRSLVALSASHKQGLEQSFLDAMIFDLDAQ